jgi:pullulanase/glycogen debranching enzyme
MTSNEIKTDQGAQTDSSFPMEQLNDLESPGEQQSFSERVTLEIQLAEVPVLSEGVNPDGTTVHYRHPELHLLTPGATFNPKTGELQVLVEADLWQVAGMEMVLFDEHGAEIPSQRVEMRKIGDWGEEVSGEQIGQFYVTLSGAQIKPGMAYGFRVEQSPDGPGVFPETRWAGDPHGRAVVPSQFKKIEIDEFTQVPKLGPEYVIPQKSIVLSVEEQDGVVSFPGVEGLEPIKRVGLDPTPQGSRVFYEMHVQDTKTIPDEWLEAEGLQGTQQTMKCLQSSVVIDYLKSLGVTHLELLPCQAYFSEGFLQAEGLKNAWGYIPESLKATHDEYFHAREAHAQLREVIETINVLHENGIAVIVDWVPGHTHEGASQTEDNRHHPKGLGPSNLLRPFAERLYYQVKEDGTYRHDSGCGNTISPNYKLGRELLSSSRDFWLDTIGVDGLRVDQASLLGRGRDGKFYDDHGYLREFAYRSPDQTPKLFIAEPNDVAEDGEQFLFGRLPHTAEDGTPLWREWNFAVRNIAQDLSRGHSLLHFEDGQPLADVIAQMVAGSANLFGNPEDDPANPTSTNDGVTYTAVHDGLTTRDFAELVINERMNDGVTENQSSVTSGLHESMRTGDLFQLVAERLRENGVAPDKIQDEMIDRLALSLLANNIFKPGDFLITRGDENLRSQGGEHDAWCNTEHIGIDWSPNINRHKVGGMVQLRKELEVFETARHFPRRGGIRWYDRQGQRRLSARQWGRSDDAFIGSVHTNSAPGQDRKSPPVFVARGEGQYLLPELPDGWGWLRRFDSTRGHPFEEKLYTKQDENDPTLQLSTLWGSAGVAVYEMVRTRAISSTALDSEELSPRQRQSLQRIQERYRVVYPEGSTPEDDERKGHTAA